MDEQTFKRRTKQFGLQVIGLVESLPRTRAADVMDRQLLRCATTARRAGDSLGRMFLQN